MKLFRRAVARHLQYVAWASDGQGVDMHLFALKWMLRDGEATPEIYTDVGFLRSTHWELSTSQLSSEYIDGWGYGEGESAVRGRDWSWLTGDSCSRRIWVVVLDRGGLCAVDDYVDEGGWCPAETLPGGGGDEDTEDVGASRGMTDVCVDALRFAPCL